MVEKKRASAGAAERASWKEDDLLFISAYGEEESRELAIAHFEDPKDGTKPSLKVLQWDASDTTLKLERVLHDMQEKLRWHVEYQADPERWRREWASAFRNRVGHVIRTSDKLADALAGLARRIRDRAIEAMNTESDRGSLKRLLKAFQESLIHDLDEEGFADTYAQTVTYGLLTAAFSRTEMSEGRHGTAFEAEDITHMVPVTNPFLKEMLGAFLTVGGRKGKIDFDELGIGDVVDLLKGDETDLPAIMADFGNKTRGEDPVIHFYEHFLDSYDKVDRKRRGVYYTPQPVVSYIVRSVHELLQTEFGLEDGLASTATWGEMLERLPDLKLPTYTDEKGREAPLAKDEPFVLILDPATGTATFIVETIDVIYRHLTEKWKKARLSDAQCAAAWNDYVPKHLLPRLFAYELMMAPYAIAHMKVGLKLAETGYQFGSDERVRIYLTNALEPAQQQLGLPDFEPLAHEAEAVNRVKREKRFTVAIGNPPYSRVSQNQSPFIKRLMNDYKEPVADEANQQPLDDDYIKFLRFAHHLQANAKCGIIGFITNHTVISGVLFRGVRQRLFEDQNLIAVVDLHGNSNIKEKCADGSKDENVFDIQAGVAVTIAVKSPWLGLRRCVFHELWGLRNAKYLALAGLSVTEVCHALLPTAPYFFLKPIDLSAGEELKDAFSLPEIFPSYSSGLMTVRDSLAIAFDREELRDRFEMFRSLSVSDEQFNKFCPVKDYRKWTISGARRNVRSDKKWEKRLEVLNYRPFDKRWIFYSSDIITYPNFRVMDNFKKRNLGLISSRLHKGEEHAHEFVTREMVEIIFLSSKSSNNAFLFPLYTYESASELALVEEGAVNLSRPFLKQLGTNLGLQLHYNSFLPAGLTPEDIFHYAYAVFHSPGYRSRYAELLKIDFPKLPLTQSLDLFKELGRLGEELAALHLLESALLEKPRTTFIGSKVQEIQKISFENDTVFIDKAQTSGFKGVPVNVWSFHIGGYQVCEKWLKDRKGRTLSDEDIAHYHKIVISLQETIRLMAEIDQVIEQYGGWPGAFATTKPPAVTPDQVNPTTPKAKAKTKPSARHNDLGLHLEGELPL